MTPLWLGTPVVRNCCTFCPGNRAKMYNRCAAGRRSVRSRRGSDEGVAQLARTPLEVVGDARHGWMIYQTSAGGEGDRVSAGCSPLETREQPCGARLLLVNSAEVIQRRW